MNNLRCAVCLRNFEHKNPNTRCCSESCRRKLISTNLRARHAASRTKKQSRISQPESHRLLLLADGRVAKVSAEDYEWARQYAWSVDHNGYVITTQPEGKRKLHREVYEREHGYTSRKLHVDHHHGDKLDNRRTELRISTLNQNIYNSKPSAGTSEFKGVSRHTTNTCWVATIHIDRLKIHIGSFKDELNAAVAYDAAAIQLYGEFAWLNIIGR